MESEKLQEIAFEIILSSGNARTLIHESFPLMRAGKFTEGREKLEESNESLKEAHKAQTGLLQDYANGEAVVMDVIMVHAQDHLMTTMTLREVALEMLELYKRQG
ncbi:PTS cellobiose transporter subunit IIA [Tetragenococcus koreensis]|uniref:Lactose-specific PTS system IIA component n=1 Tax=Tetragenococcus koreensis TaxID=290335 RepID=A0AAN4UAZ7_9ENTE|nr:PTS cellobiose transporter subunit IIA [Tetragenococcus koreensis]AYW45891.1 PTS cellobiose transporter subunit IIA [Tetragenococcus koreensis]MCF1586263.1 PTS cellobiose transporter subunit IIA [Tetragenococcus koreensis]MCF1615850.1 PTS cellobiose transporter subunit IIA [Tetragenococcus koreensis]MCF1617366.1 PTS cellobiose transporter subunit IIA [Tetragenococcus koreensis]MCF1619020.1 PTS cellobiose transporter subunit IIA [Tetragenococcus koreensis]